jgi:hypothetical protein
MSITRATEELGQGYTIDTMESDTGHTYYRVCIHGTCRYAEDYWMVLMYAESMGWLPSHKQPID